MPQTPKPPRSADILLLNDIGDEAALEALSERIDIDLLRAQSEAVRGALLQNLERVEGILDFELDPDEFGGARQEDIDRFRSKVSHLRGLVERMAELALRTGPVAPGPHHACDRE
jgi:hypothetical protein